MYDEYVSTGFNNLLSLSIVAIYFGIILYSWLGFISWVVVKAFGIFKKLIKF